MQVLSNDNIQSKLRFSSALPWVARIAQNDVLNREIIDTLGFEPYMIATAKTKNDRRDRWLDFAGWVSLALVLPALTGKLISASATKSLLNQFPQLPKTAKPLLLPFEALSASAKITPAMLSHSGIPEASLVTSALRKGVLSTKVLLMAQTLAIMGVVVQGYGDLRTALVKRFSSPPASEQSRAPAKSLKEKWSMALGVLGNVSLPLLVLAAARQKNAGALTQGFLKQFNTYNVVYNSRYVLLWHALWNWNLKGIMLSPNKKERWQNVARSASSDFFMVFGDLLVSGLLAKGFERQFPKNNAVKLSKPGFLGLPIGVSPAVLHQQLTKGVYQKLPELLKQKAQRLANTQFMLGLVATSALMLGATVGLNRLFAPQKT